MATVAVLDIALRAKTDKFREGMKKAEGTLGRLRSAVSKVVPLLGPAGLAGAALAAGVAFKRLVIDSFATLDAMGKLSDRLGIATEDLAGFQLAASITGVDLETMNKSLEQLAKRIGEAASEVSELTPTLKRMNLEATELVRKDPSEVFRIIAEKISNIGTQAEKAAAANDFFGRSGIKLINVLDLGAEGIDRFIAEAKELGIALSRDAIKKVEDANDAIARMNFAFAGLGRTLAVDLAPAIEVFAKALKGIARIVPFLTGRLIGQKRALRDILIPSKQAAESMEDLAEQMEQVANKAATVFRETRTDAEKFNERMKELNSLINAGAISWDTYTRAIKRAQQGQEGLSDATRNWDRIIRNANAATAAARNIIEETLTPQERFAKGWELIQSLLTVQAITQEVYNRKLAQLSKELNSATKSTEDLNRVSKADLEIQKNLIDAAAKREATLKRQKRAMEGMEARGGAATGRLDIGTFRQVNLDRAAIGGISPKRQKQLVEDPQIRRTNELLIAIRNSVAGGNLAGARTV